MPTTSMMINALESWRQTPDGANAAEFWKLVERFRADLVNQAFALIGSQPDAEDVAQETLVTAFTNLDRLRDARKLGNWMRRINHNRALSHRQKVQRQRRLAEEAAERSGTTGSHTKALSNQELIADAIDKLPEELRVLLALRYWEHLEYEEMARRLGLPVGTVKSRIARADRLLEQKLRPALGLPPAPAPIETTAKE